MTRNQTESISPMREVLRGSRRKKGGRTMPWRPKIMIIHLPKKRMENPAKGNHEGGRAVQPERSSSFGTKCPSKAKEEKTNHL
mmetsp:Transcript_26210/g.45611  ORF Transcript_26210/g.45611 Transcript_26210/m.45611 type:complete len:83 (+) Transcript_26210:202-450(+)